MKKIFLLPIILFSFFIFISILDENVNAYDSIQIEKLSGRPTDILLEVNDEGVNGTVKTDKGQGAFNSMLNQYRKIINFVCGIGCLSMIMFFIFNLIKLGGSQGNPQERKQAITGLIITGISTAILGSITLVTGLFYSMFI